MTGEEAKLAELHGLDTEQIAGAGTDQQYGLAGVVLSGIPADGGRSFRADFDSYIPADLVLRARKRSAATAASDLGGAYDAEADRFIPDRRG